MSHLLTSQSQAITTLTLNRPEVHNAFDDQLITELHQAFMRLQTDKQTRVVVLRSEGKHFSAGADLNWMQASIDFSEQQNIDDAKRLADMLNALKQLPQVTIAVVQGAAFGGAIGLISCCDIALAKPEAKFCFSEVKLGLIPAVISPFIIETIGKRRARELFLTARTFNASDAVSYGLIHQTIDNDDVLQAVCQQILSNSPQAITACKHLLQQLSELHSEAEITELTSRAIANIRVSNEAQAGLKAFFNQNPAPWQDKA